MSIEKISCKEFFSKQRYINLINIVFEYLDIYDIIKLSNINKKVFVLLKEKVNPTKLKLNSYFDYSEIRSDSKTLKYNKDYYTYSFIKSHLKEFAFTLDIQKQINKVYANPN